MGRILFVATTNELSQNILWVAPSPIQPRDLVLARHAADLWHPAPNIIVSTWWIDISTVINPFRAFGSLIVKACLARPLPSDLPDQRSIRLMNRQRRQCSCVGEGIGAQRHRSLLRFRRHSSYQSGRPSDPNRQKWVGKEETHVICLLSSCTKSNFFLSSSTGRYVPSLFKIDLKNTFLAPGILPARLYDASLPEWFSGDSALMMHVVPDCTACKTSSFVAQ